MIKTELNKECGIRLKNCLEEFPMTQNELSSLTGYTQQYISNIVVGKKPMTIKAARIFAKHLNVRTEYLLCEDDNKTNIQYVRNALNNPAINRLMGLLGYEFEFEIAPCEKNIDMSDEEYRLRKEAMNAFFSKLTSMMDELSDYALYKFSILTEELKDNINQLK